MSDHLIQPKRPIDEVDASLKELVKDVQSLKSDISYIKNNIKQFMKEKEKKEIQDIQTMQEGWWLWR
tara:strand:+ start:1030 stop:1230 length:201 start_codon:yes stop_codon:yes gene_type:complete